MTSGQTVVRRSKLNSVRARATAKNHHIRTLDLSSKKEAKPAGIDRGKYCPPIKKTPYNKNKCKALTTDRPNITNTDKYLQARNPISNQPSECTNPIACLVQLLLFPLQPLLALLYTALGP